MKAGRVRQNHSEGKGWLPTVRRVANENPNSALAFAAWTMGTVGAVAFAFRGRTKNEPYSKILTQGTLSALGSHLTATGVGISDALSSGNAGAEQPTQQEKDVATILNKFFDNTSCSNVSITADGSGKFTLIVRVLFERKKYPAKLNSSQMKSIQAATTNEKIYNIILPELKKQSVKSTFKNDKPPKLSILNQGSNICF